MFIKTRSDELELKERLARMPDLKTLLTEVVISEEMQKYEHVVFYEIVMCMI